MSSGVDTSIYRQQLQPNALQTAAGMATLAGAVGSAQSHQLDVAMRKLGALHGEFSALASKPDLSLTDIQDTADRLVRAGLATPEEAAKEVAIAQRLGNDPVALRGLAGTHLQNVIDTHQRFTSAYGNVDTQDLGDNMLTRAVSPVTGVRPLSVSPKTLTPQDKASRLPTFQGGQAGTAPASALTDRYGNPRQAPIGGAQASAGGTAAGGAMAPAGFTPTAPALGQTRVAEGGADQYVRDLQASAGNAGRISNLQSVLTNLDSLGPEGTGTGVAGRNRIASFLNAAGLSKLPGVDPKRIEDLDEATAYLNNAARSGALDAAKGEAGGQIDPATLNTNLSAPALKNLVRAQIGQERFRVAQAQSYKGSDSGAGYASHAAAFANDQDPRAYSIDLRTPEEKRKLIQSLGSPDSPAYRKFRRSLETAHRLGLTNGGR